MPRVNELTFHVGVSKQLQIELIVDLIPLFLFSLDTLKCFQFYEFNIFPPKLALHTSKYKALSLMLLNCLANVKHCLRKCSFSSQDIEKVFKEKNICLFVWKQQNDFEVI